MSELINGEDALRALADGNQVEASNSDFRYWIDAKNLSVNDFFDDIHIFRLKPHTVKLEIEVPAPFEPKVGDYVYFICSDEIKGYAETTLEDTPMNWGFVQFGAWRTEAEIKIVVEQLRKLGALK